MITIAFDADDTLWDNEIYFRESERQFCKLINSHNPNLTEKEIMSSSSTTKWATFRYMVLESKVSCSAQ
jgi:hypothetical protein